MMCGSVQFDDSFMHIIVFDHILTIDSSTKITFFSLLKITFHEHLQQSGMGQAARTFKSLSHDVLLVDCLAH